MEQMDYTLGRGELYFNKFNPGTMIGSGERYIGNTPELNQTVESENLDHFNSDRGVNEKDASVVLQTNRSLNFTTDHISPENVALFFFGSTEVLTQVAATGETDEFEAVRQGLFYQLGTSDANPTGARNVTNVVVTDDAATPTTYVFGTDYLVDEALGRIEVLLGGNIASGTNLTVTFDTQASTSTLVMSGAKPIEGSMRFVAHNAAGSDKDYFWPWVKLTPNGDYALKGDEWQTIPFNVEVLRASGREAVYIRTRGVVAP